MRIVAALGGNALIRRGQQATVDVQRQNVARAAEALAPLAAEHELIITHGNGPQVGLLALQAEAYPDVPPYPLDVLDAETEGMIGHLLELELRNRLPGRDIATLLTQIEVAADDPSLLLPTKPIGPVYDVGVAEDLAAKRGWSIAADGVGMRRVVGSPEPVGILGAKVIDALVEDGTVVICAGGGGIPVARDDSGLLRGVEAVIDKDRASALLAQDLGADILLLLTDVHAVMAGWGTPDAHPIRQINASRPGDLDLPTGSMGPKVQAACRFAEKTGGVAIIGALGQAAMLAEGCTGTLVVRDRHPVVQSTS